LLLSTVLVAMGCCLFGSGLWASGACEHRRVLHHEARCPFSAKIRQQGRCAVHNAYVWFYKRVLCMYRARPPRSTALLIARDCVPIAFPAVRSRLEQYSTSESTSMSSKKDAKASKKQLRKEVGAQGVRRAWYAGCYRIRQPCMHDCSTRNVFKSWRLW